MAREITIRVTLDGKDDASDDVRRAEGSIKSLDRSTQGFGSRARSAFKGLGRSLTVLNQGLGAVGKIFRGVSRAVGFLTRGLRQNVAASEEQIKAEQRAVAGLSSRAKFTEQNFEELQKFNGSLQQTIGIGDEVSLTLQGTLGALKVMPGQIRPATLATIGLAEAMGGTDEGTLKSASRTVARAFQGDLTMLKRYGITATNTKDAIKQLTDLFDLAAIRSQNLSTRWLVLKANTGDLREVWGKATSSSGALRAGIDAVSASTLRLQKFFDSPSGREAVNGFYQTLLKGAALGIQAFAGLLKVADNVRRTMIVFVGEVQDLLGVPRTELKATAGAMDKFADEMLALSAGLKTAASKGVDEIKPQKLAKGMGAVRASLRGAAGAMDDLGASASKTKKKIEEIGPPRELFETARTQEIQKAFDGLTPTFDRLSASFGRNARDAEILDQKLSDAESQTKATAKTLGSQLVGSVRGFISAAQEGGDAVEEFLLGALEQVGLKLASLAVSKVLELVLGPIGGGIGGGILGALFNSGGIVGGVGALHANTGLLVPGNGVQDSVPVMTTPGEGILDRGSTREVLEGRAIIAAPQAVAAAGGGGTTVVHERNELNALAPPPRAYYRRTYQHRLGNEFRRMRRNRVNI